MQSLGPDALVPGLLAHLERAAARGVVRDRPDAVRAATLNALHVCPMPAAPRPYEALELLLEDAERHGEDSGLLTARAVMYAQCAPSLAPDQQAGAVEGAVEYAERAVRADPADAVALFDHAAILAGIGATRACERALRHLLDAIDTGAAAARPDRLVHRTSLDDFTVAWLGASLDGGAGAGPALTRLLAGEAAERLAALTTAPAERAALLRRAIQARPVAFDARRSLAAVLAREGDLEGALTQVEAAQRIKPLVEVVAEERLALLVGLGRLDDAAQLAADTTALARRMPRRAALGERMAARLSSAALIVRPV